MKRHELLLILEQKVIFVHGELYLSTAGNDRQAKNTHQPTELLRKMQQLLGDKIMANQAHGLGRVCAGSEVDLGQSLPTCPKILTQRDAAPSTVTVVS